MSSAPSPQADFPNETTDLPAAPPPLKALAEQSDEQLAASKDALSYFNAILEVELSRRQQKRAADGAGTGDDEAAR